MEEQKVKRGMFQNTIVLIRPYRIGDVWVFDEPRAGVEREPFVGATNQMIDLIVGAENLTKARSGFNLIFSEQPFPGYTAQLDWVRSEFQGNWYRWNKEQIEGWLCAAMYLYFPEAPKVLYAKAEV